MSVIEGVVICVGLFCATILIGLLLICQTFKTAQNKEEESDEPQS